MLRNLACLIIPPPASTAIRRLQRELAYEPLLPPHLTLVPPKPPGPAWDRVVERLRERARRTPPFALLLGPSDTFTVPEPVVYLRVSGPGARVLYDISAELGDGGAPAEHPFVPHVTVVRGVAPPVVAACLAATRGASWPVTVDAAELIRVHPTGDGLRWDSTGRYPFTAGTGEAAPTV